MDIPGTHVSILPPKGFVLKNEITGIANDSNTASVLVHEFHQPVVELFFTFKKDNLALYYGELLGVDTITFNGLKSILVHMNVNSDDVHLSKWVLVTGDNKRAIMISGITDPKHEKQYNDVLKKCVTGIVYDSLRKIDPFQSFPFSMDNKTKFSFSKREGHDLEYYLANDTNDNHIGYMTVSYGTLKEDDLEPELYTTEKMYSSLRDVTEIVNQSKARLNAPLNGKEIIATAIDFNTKYPVRIYHAMHYIGNTYYRLTAVYNFNYDGFEKDCRGMMGSFKLR